MWNDFNNLIDRIPAPVKAAVAIAGTGVAIASGVAPGAAVLTMAMAMGEGAAVNLAFYAVGSYVTGKQMTWKDAIKTAGKGALDGAFLNGIGQGIAGAGRILVNNKAGIKNFYVDETGSVKIDGLSGGKTQVFDIVEYGDKTSGLENHHGVLDVWATNNIDGYKSRASKSTTIALTPEQHATTKLVYRDWLYERTGKKVGGKVDWTSVSPQEAQALSQRMFDAANVPLSARNDYYREFNRYIYGLGN